MIAQILPARESYGGFQSVFSRQFAHGLAATLFAALAVAIWHLPDDLVLNGRIALIVTLLCAGGWALTRIPDSLIAIAGATALVAFGILPQERFYAALGHEMVWLLLAAFLMAAVLRGSGLLESLAAMALKPFTSIAGLFYALTGIIALTAFVVPSTSGRAALLLPVFWSLAGRMPDERLVRPLALLFPTAILLSAGGSLIGAGAHFIAIDAIAQHQGTTIGYVQWIALALPLTLAASFAATWLIIRIFVPSDLRRLRPAVGSDERQPLNSRQQRIAAAVCVMIALWIAQPLHGLSLALVAVIGAAFLLTSWFSPAKTKDVFKQVEVELIVFLATTLVISDALLASGASAWLAKGLIAALPATVTQSLPFVAMVVATVSVLAHLLINSRSARAAVLIPAFALPLAGMGHDAALLVLITVLGTGFCQSTMASAKPVAVYGNLDRETFTQGDLARLALPLMAVKLALLMIFALAIWPTQLAGLKPTELAPRAAAAESAALPLAVAPPKPKPMHGALCTREELSLVMTSTIAQHRMWASGWWRVWKRLSRQGMAVEQSAVRDIYRGEAMVKLRRHSVRIGALAARAGDIAAARRACFGGAE